MTRPYAAVTRRSLIATLLLPLTGFEREDDRLRVSVNGETIISTWGKLHSDALVPIAQFCTRLGAHVKAESDKRGTVTIILGSRWVRVELASRQALYLSPVDGRRIGALLKEAPVTLKGQLWVPLSVAVLIGATVTRNKNDFGVSVVEEDSAANWQAILGLSSEFRPANDGVLGITRFKVAAAGRTATEDSEFVLTIAVSRPAHFQVYEVFEGKPEPMFGYDDNQIRFYPLRDGKQPCPAPIDGRRNFVFRCTRPGTYWYVALATTAPITADLREAAAHGKPPDDWAIRGQRFEVEKKR